MKYSANHPQDYSGDAEESAIYGVDFRRPWPITGNNFTDSRPKPDGEILKIEPSYTISLSQCQDWMTGYSSSGEETDRDVGTSELGSPADNGGNRDDNDDNAEEWRSGGVVME